MVLKVLLYSSFAQISHKPYTTPSKALTAREKKETSQRKSAKFAYQKGGVMGWAQSSLYSPQLVTLRCVSYFALFSSNHAEEQPLPGRSALWVFFFWRTLPEHWFSYFCGCFFVVVLHARWSLFPRGPPVRNAVSFFVHSGWFFALPVWLVVIENSSKAPGC